MLGNYPIDVVLKARDLAAAKDFYADTLGLRVLSDKKLRTERPSSHQGSELLVQDRRRQSMFYRVAIQKDPSALWKWESRVIASREVLLRVLGMYRSMPRDHLRVFFSSSVEGLDLLLDREKNGLASNSIPVDQFFQERRSTSQGISQLEMRQFESEPRIRKNEGMVETSTVGEPSVHEMRRSTIPAGSMDVLDRRRLELELGTPGDHDTCYTFTFPTSLPRVLAWMKLLAQVQDGAFQP